MLKNYYTTIFLVFILPAFLMAQGRYSTTKKSAIKLYESAMAERMNLKPDMDKYEGLLKQAMEKDVNFIEPYHSLLELYDQFQKFDLATETFEQYIQLDNPYKSAVDYYKGAGINMKSGSYDSAKKYADIFVKMYSQRRNGDPVLLEKGKKMLASSSFAVEAKKNPVPFKPKNAGPGINTANPEYFPTLTGDDSTLYLTRRVPEPHTELLQQEDIFVSHMDEEGFWMKALNLGPEVNRRYKNEGAPSISADGRVLITTICEDQSEDRYGKGRKGFGSCDLFISYKKGDAWTPPTNMGAPVNSWDWETQPSISADGKTIYFIRGKRKVNGVRMRSPHDPNIYVSNLEENGKWSIPTKLNINTPQPESSVLIHPDGQTLYFSSEGYPGMGSSDLYVSYKQPNGLWSTPKNLGYPINTHKMENSLVVSSTGKLAYFSSDREGGYGDLDIYSFELPENLRPTYTTYMKGVVYDAKTNQKLEASFELIDLESSNTIVKSVSDPEKGSFLVTIPTNKDYALNVSKKGYAFYSENFSMTEKANKKEPFEINIPLIPIEKVGEAITLKNVFFDLDKATLKPKSKIELDKLYSFLEENTTIKIELRGHTDNQGEEAYNLTLSDNRAKAVVDYLVKKGIDNSRLSYKGYGESKPIASNDTKEGRAKNRRTEYVILK